MFPNRSIVTEMFEFLSVLRQYNTAKEGQQNRKGRTNAGIARDPVIDKYKLGD
jgi:hypothetical protein